GRCHAPGTAGWRPGDRHRGRRRIIERRRSAANGEEVEMQLVARTMQCLAVAAVALATLANPAAALDKVKVGVFPVGSSLPYFVAVERGYFKDQGIETEMSRLIGGTPNIAAMISNQIDVGA